ncbi:AAA family ATPase [Azospirillum isscasi]|uniref:AAA family ATPase n=1 Tax=Azospirillum isscasi TaxID=3053926 RepID=A0ABU0WGZ5_9PROT|nr:AAA family ATPase [Azospirillum isscasi]MDQ2103435.1 AAA family ATPase [Azospirillum isscasi]
MKTEAATKERSKFIALLDSISAGNVYFVTGKNGSGKSRFFAYATQTMCEAQLTAAPQTSRLLCLSGTMHDKYPRIIYKYSPEIGGVVYLGNKVNNNMVSDIAPFRTLCYHMVRNASAKEYLFHARSVMERLNFDQRIKLKFRYAKNRKVEAFGAVDPQVDYVLDTFKNDPRLMDRYLEHISAGNILLADMCFFRNQEEYGLDELSSGEKQYALALLGFIFCGSRNSVVFYDEPENSLHPSWQLSIVKDLAEVASDFHHGSTLIVATHSPLIASSVRNGSVYVCDLPAGQNWQRSDLYGRTSDTVLREQFHLFSARSPEVAKIINTCLTYISRNQTGGDEFHQAQDQLRSYNLDLTPDDPLYEVVTTIMRF